MSGDQPVDPEQALEQFAIHNLEYAIEQIDLALTKDDARQRIQDKVNELKRIGERGTTCPE